MLLPLYYMLRSLHEKEIYTQTQNVYFFKIINGIFAIIAVEIFKILTNFIFE